MGYRLSGSGKNSLILNPTKKGRNALVDVKKAFFDRKAVENAMDRATKRALSRFGAFVRSDARHSLRHAGLKTPPSTPPAPPRSRTGLLKRFIFFAYEHTKQTVVIGPVRLPRMKYKDNLIMLEYGGMRWMQIHGRRVMARYRARPFMRPAYDRNIDNLGKFYKDSM